MSNTNHFETPGSQSLDAVRERWLFDRQQATPRPLAEWVVEHEELRDEIVWWELAYRRGGPTAVEEFAELESIIAQPIDLAGLRASIETNTAPEPKYPSLLKAMEAAEVKPADIARKLGVGNTVISRMLKGQVDPLTTPLSLLVTFAQMVNTKLDALIAMLSTPQSTPQAAMYKRAPRGRLPVNSEEAMAPAAKPSGVTSTLLSFEEAVAKAPDMTAEEKQAWISDYSDSNSS